MALNGLAGHKCSHLPQPIHFSVSIAGTSAFLPSGVVYSTIWIAHAGQWRAQAPHESPFATGMQLSAIHTACPICIAVLSSGCIGRMAPVGQTWEQRVHSGLQKPRSKDISGCMNRKGSEEGRSTLLGHALTHSWQAVQCLSMLRAESDPGGVRGVCRCGAFLSSISARPPSTLIFVCAIAADPMAKSEPARKARREASGFILSAERSSRASGLKCSASKWHWSRQSPQAIQRL